MAESRFAGVPVLVLLPVYHLISAGRVRPETRRLALTQYCLALIEASACGQSPPSLLAG